MSSRRRCALLVSRRRPSHAAAGDPSVAIQDDGWMFPSNADAVAGEDGEIQMIGSSEILLFYQQLAAKHARVSSLVSASAMVSLVVMAVVLVSTFGP
jgi:hypothetical protein